MHTIEVRNYSKRIKQASILENISMVLESGKIYGLVGRNGSGKTMLLRALARLISPTTGTILFDGIDMIKAEAIKLRSGIVLEHAEMYPHLTGFENLTFLASINKKIANEEIKQAMKRVGLNPTDKRTYKKYSLGMKQRLAIAQAIMEKPEYLLFDEPTNALDSEGLELWRSIILEEKKRGAIIVLCSHSKEEIHNLCDHVYSMREGRVIADE